MCISAILGEGERTLVCFNRFHGILSKDELIIIAATILFAFITPSRPTLANGRQWQFMYFYKYKFIQYGNFQLEYRSHLLFHYTHLTGSILKSYFNFMIQSSFFEIPSYIKIKS